MKFPMPVPPIIGLCASCAHHRVIESRRGSRFHLCERSSTDVRFPKYPPLPVRACPGHESTLGPDSEDDR